MDESGRRAAEESTRFGNTTLALVSYSHYGVLIGGRGDGK